MDKHNKKELNKSNKTPLRYPGGKSKAIYKLEKCLPRNFPSSITEFHDCFLGGGSIPIYITKLFPSMTIKVNDIYEPLYNFWINLRDKGTLMADQILIIKGDNNIPELAEKLFYTQKDLLNNNDSSSLDRAIAFWIINKCSFSGLMSSSFSKQASISNFSVKCIHSLKYYSTLIQNWEIYNLDYREFNNLYNKDKSDVLLYLDPPYMIKDNLYGDKGKLHEIFKHESFFNFCKSLKCKQLISYNSDNLIKESFKDYVITDYDLTYTLRSTGSYMQDQKKRKELAITNYKERIGSIQ